MRSLRVVRVILLPPPRGCTRGRLTRARDTNEIALPPGGSKLRNIVQLRCSPWRLWRLDLSPSISSPES